jgi:hypothetical protein
MSRTTATKQRRATVARLGRRCRPSPLPFGPAFLAGGCRARLFPIAHPIHAALRFWAFGIRLLRLLSTTASGKAAKPLIRYLTPAQRKLMLPIAASGLRQRACRTKTARG